MLTIGSLAFPSPLVLAPLAGYSDLPFRLLCREYGAGFCVSEMISCHGLCYRQQKTIDMLLSTPAERPVAFQLFGADPDRMAEAAAIISTFGPDMIDINMGCPVKKVTKRGAGAALMASPELAEKIILRVVANTSLPVTVKIRAGIKASEVNGTEFARMAQGSGASAVIVHGRTWAQGFSGQADRTIIAAIKQALTIPVIGNGDIQTYQEAMEMLEETGCDGVMIGRAALGNPWVFSAAGRPGDLGAIVDGALRHLNLVEQFLGANRPISVIRNHIGKYFKNLPGSSDIRRAVYNCPALTDLKNLLLAFRDINEEIGTTAITGGAA
ncbi:tRNA dihydrouridine synthase DusB [Desulfoprunum benzoelyticum]|uniref:tRNA dihydrouridine synthase DusB n=1 Tax=Desulfoprunum benzoelyticum TaxID=1506996 RepID=UPI00162191A5|nr:tRNA dihydrouridine synthase DusB [Desulfoprunum benzoelyticum]MBM9528584.1 tRNA dihydrouridine synthase DusB [Desulfoprunum benzoelyticum]